MGPDETILSRLVARGVTLLPPAKPADWNRLERWCGLTPGPDVRAVTARFDGFLVHDPASMLMLWSIDAIIANGTLSAMASGHTVAIGDSCLNPI